MYEPIRHAGVWLRPAASNRQDPGFQRATIKPQVATPAAHSARAPTPSVRVTMFLRRNHSRSPIVQESRNQLARRASRRRARAFTKACCDHGVGAPNARYATAGSPSLHVIAKRRRRSPPIPGLRTKHPIHRPPPSGHQRLPEKLQALAGFTYTFCSLARDGRFRRLGPSLEQKLGFTPPNSSSKSARSRRGVGGKEGFEDTWAAKRKSRRFLASRCAAMANPLRVDASTPPRF